MFFHCGEAPGEDESHRDTTSTGLSCRVSTRQQGRDPNAGSTGFCDLLAKIKTQKLAGVGGKSKQGKNDAGMYTLLLTGL